MRAWQVFEGQTNRGYKVMRYENGRAIAGADSRQSFVPRVGTTVSMDGNGIYMSPNKQYVLDYYSGLHDNEILLTFEFDPSEITFGNLTDRESEIAVVSAKIVDVEALNHLT